MKVYIAGPMTGLPEHNYPEFNRVAKQWRDAGHEVINPAENHNGDTTLPLAEYFKTDLPQVCDVDAVVVLDNWHKSKGANIEVTLARHLGKPVLHWESGFPLATGQLTVQETALQEAQRLVHGDRQDSYGHPIEDFTRTGRMWGAILGIPDVPPDRVGLCMAAVKISREVNKPKRDNRVDMAGYAETVDLVRQRLDSVTTGDPNGL